MDQFKLEIAEGIAIVKVDIPSATLREAKPMWELFESEMIFDWKKIIIDLTACTFIDSTFIGMIIKIFRRVNEKESQMKLVFPQITDIESFRVVGITKILECFNSVENAIKSYQPHASVKRIDIDQKSLYHSIMHV
jgi:anti-anti-sigma factor